MGTSILTYEDNYYEEVIPSMSNEVKSYEGTVAYAGGKEFSGKTLYSLRINEVDEWFRCGTKRPQCSKGDRITFDVVSTPKGDFVEVDSITVKGSPKEEADVSPAAAKRSKAANKASGNDREKYWEDKAKADVERQNIISRQAAMNTAIAMIAMAGSIDSLPPLGTRKADKFDNLKGIVYTLADELWMDYANSGGGAKMGVTPSHVAEATEKVATLDEDMFGEGE